MTETLQADVQTGVEDKTLSGVIDPLTAESQSQTTSNQKTTSSRRQEARQRTQDEIDEANQKVDEALRRAEEMERLLEESQRKNQQVEQERQIERMNAQGNEIFSKYLDQNRITKTQFEKDFGESFKAKVAKLKAGGLNHVDAIEEALDATHGRTSAVESVTKEVEERKNFREANQSFPKGEEEKTSKEDSPLMPRDDWEKMDEKDRDAYATKHMNTDPNSPDAYIVQYAK